MSKLREAIEVLNKSISENPDPSPNEKAFFDVFIALAEHLAECKRGVSTQGTRWEVQSGDFDVKWVKECGTSRPPSLNFLDVREYPDKTLIVVYEPRAEE